MTWNAEQYKLFTRQREQPFHDLVALVDNLRAASSSSSSSSSPSPLLAVDLGCGTGKQTAMLHASLPPASSTIGIDSSPEMLAAPPAADGLRFLLGDVARPESLGVEPGSVDILFSNACLHWLPDHPELLKNRTSPSGHRPPATDIRPRR